MGREPFLKTLTRTTVVAGALGVVVPARLPRHASLFSDFVDVFTVAFLFHVPRALRRSAVARLARDPPPAWTGGARGAVVRWWAVVALSSRAGCG